MRWTHAVLAGLLAFAACSGSDEKSPTDTDTMVTDTHTTPTDSVYAQLGGDAGVNAVLTSFIGHVGGDARINWFFANTDLAALQGLLHDQICEATGGGCSYTGKDMLSAHLGMAITDAQFSALVEDLLLGLDDNSVPYTADFSGGLPADTLMLALAGMQGDIVEDPAGDSVYFNQLGGHDSITLVVSTFLGKVGADSRINARFADTDLAELQGYLVDQICEATGGACVYDGLNMYDAHDGLFITDEEFDALVEDLLAALDDLGVPYTPGLDGTGLADPLLLVLAGMRSDVVGH